MRIFNKVVESKKEPSNKNDVWIDRNIIKIYKEEEWQSLKTSETFDDFSLDFNYDFNADFTIKN